jgi:vacuolar-type H+-ATPase subunit H
LEEKNPSYVEGILNTLADLERKSETLISDVELMKKQLASISIEEIESIKRQVIDRANNEAQMIIDASRKEAEGESLQISKESDDELSLISKNIDSSFDKAVEMVVQKIREDFILPNSSSNKNNNNNTDANSNFRSDLGTETKTQSSPNATVSGTTKRPKKDNMSA